MTTGKWENLLSKYGTRFDMPEEAWELFKKIYESGIGLSTASRSIRLLNKEYDYSDSRIKKECLIRGYKLRPPTRRIEYTGENRR